MCGASDSQKFAIVFLCTLLSLKETVHVLRLAGRDALGENKLTFKTLNLRCAANHGISACAVRSVGFIYHDEVELSTALLLVFPSSAEAHMLPLIFCYYPLRCPV